MSTEGLYEAAQRCFRGTDWKPSVAAFELNALERCQALSEDLRSGTYEPREPRRFEVTRPKRRSCRSVCIRDRVWQRSLCDNVVYPAMAPSLVRENCACQRGKGTDFARSLLKEGLRSHWRSHGTEGFALLVDVSGYYPNMRHDVAMECLARRLDPWSLSLAGQILDVQGSGEVGYDPGSQLVQLVGISVLSPLDHMVKERLRVRRYVRYMDDMVLVLPTREEAERAISLIAEDLARIGYEPNRRKTHVQPLSEPVPFLGFTFLLRPTGYVLVRMRSERVRDARRRLRRVAEAAAAGRVSAGKADEIAQTAIRYMLANCSDRASPRKMEAYWNELRREFT